MQPCANLHGFAVKRVRELPELAAKLWELEHEKTGAQLCWLDRADENKTFSIAFKTIPQDSTGVFHILEHSVLCGSDKYPVKEPFVNLLKTSVQTFLNAMTYPDKTVYPVSSRNDRDFLNLMDVYLDAVLHPAIYHKPEIFRQEGWRYELGDTPVYQGVVFNEMKGAYSSPDTVMESTVNALLFPDTCYRYESGGDPACIPDLTYEQFLANHKKFYHPSNARISLVGSVDMEAALAKIDGFLKNFDREPADFTIPMQLPVAAVERRVPYEVGAEEPLEGRTMVCCATLLGSYADTDRYFAASVLADYLTGDNDAPLKRAILDAGLGQDVSVNVRSDIQQSWVSWEVCNTDADKLPEIRAVIRTVLQKLADEGLDARRLEACYNRFAFSQRDRDGSGLPRSLMEALTMLDSWLYGGDPAQPLLVEQPLEKLAAGLNTDLFAGLIRELFLDESHSVTAVLVPSHTAGAEKAKNEAERLAAEAAAWTPEKRAALQKQAEELTRWQQTPDSEEAVRTIPMLQLSDLKQAPEDLPVAVTKRGNITVLRHKTNASLVYLNVYFEANDLAEKELPVLTAMSMLLGTAGTKQHSSEELQMLIKQKIGSIRFQVNTLPGEDVEHCRVQLVARMACLPEQNREAVGLLAEILRGTDFSDRKLLRDQLSQAALNAQMNLAANGEEYAEIRVGAYNSARGVAREALCGREMAVWLKEQAAAEDTVLDTVLQTMQTLAVRILAENRMTVSCSDNLEEKLLDILALPQGSPAPKWAVYAPWGARQEGLTIPASVSFAVKGTNFKCHGGSFSGCYPVLVNILTFTYLWGEIRVQGGAYGCGLIARNDGDVAFYTYRDPQPGRSLKIIDGAAQYIRDLCAAESDLTGYILGSVSTLDPLLNTRTAMLVAETRYFKGTTYADICRYYSQLVHTSHKDLLELCRVLDEIAADNAVCVVAGKALLDDCGAAVTSRLSI